MAVLSYQSQTPIALSDYRSDIALRPGASYGESIGENLGSLRTHAPEMELKPAGCAREWFARSHLVNRLSVREVVRGD